MASSEKFKQAIREGRLNDAFVLAIGEAPQLQINTWIASPESSINQSQAGKFLQTHIDLVEGEITNKIGSEIIEDNLYSKAQQFHIQQVSQGHQSIRHNLESLQHIFRLMAILQKQKQGESYQPIAPFRVSSASFPDSQNIQISGSKTLGNQETVVSSINPISILTEEGSVEDNMLSLGSLEAEADKIPYRANPNQEDSDWGDWLDEDDENLEFDAELLTLDAFDVDESEEWGDETEFLPSSQAASPEKDDNQPQEK